jgi:hypothetical protein
MDNLIIKVSAIKIERDDLLSLPKNFNLREWKK